MITGVNHITIAVSDLDASLAFYVDLLGMLPKVRWDRGAYLTAGDIWLCLTLDKPKPAEDYSHIAFSISKKDFADLSQRLTESEAIQWQPNTSEGDSLYILDPDGHKLEFHLGDLESRLNHLKHNPYPGLHWY